MSVHKTPVNVSDLNVNNLSTIGPSASLWPFSLQYCVEKGGGKKYSWEENEWFKLFESLPVTAQSLKVSVEAQQRQISPQVW